MVTVTTTQVPCIHAFVSRDTNGMIALPLVTTLMSVYLAPMIVFHRPDASTHQGPTVASVLPSWGGPSMVDRATTLMSASIQMFVTHKLRASTFQEDLTAVVMWDGGDKAHILYVLISMNVLKRLISNFFLYAIGIQVV